MLLVRVFFLFSFVTLGQYHDPYRLRNELSNISSLATPTNLQCTEMFQLVFRGCRVHCMDEQKEKKAAVKYSRATVGKA